MSDQEKKREALQNCLPMIELVVKGIDTYRERAKQIDSYVQDDELTDAYARLQWVHDVIFWHITGIYPWSDMANDHDLKLTIDDIGYTDQD